MKYIIALVLLAACETKPTDSTKPVLWDYSLKNPPTSFESDMIFTDLFDTPVAIVKKIKTPVCYFSAGSYEDWRPDKDKFPKAAVGDPLGDWPGESWINTKDDTVRGIMKTRIDKCKANGYIAIDPDNMDGYSQKLGAKFKLSKADSIDYAKYLADYAHKQGLKIYLKNSLEIIPDLVSSMDGAVNEECVRYKECPKLSPWIQAGKPVFHVEYAGVLADVCKVTKPLGLQTIMKHLDLGSFIQRCP